jgi:hypothetical protein
MKKILSIISLITIFVPITMLFVWKPTSPNATAIAIGYCIFIAISFLYALFLFLKLHIRDIYTKIGLGVNALYLIGVLALVVLPRLL